MRKNVLDNLLRKVLCLLAALLGATSSVPAQVATEAATIAPVGLWDLAKVSLGLIVVVVSIIATAALLKRVKSNQAKNGSYIKLLDGLPIGTRERIVLLEVQNQRILVGISPGRIQALHTFSVDAFAEKSFADLVEEMPVHTEAVR
ncbi:MAG: flagellar protein FliO/FliZ [Gammaproteobacteria bacterium]